MLHKDKRIVSPEMLSLTIYLQLQPELKEFYLVGGTALALQLGHRNSVDIDLFTQNDFKSENLSAFLKSQFNDVKIDHEGKKTCLTVIDKIKVDFITHPYPFIKPPITEEGITYLSKEDIAAMKLNAIINSGQRLKDFIDVYFLLEHFSVKNMVGFFEKKYPNTNPLVALKALSYFGDIDESIDPPKLLKPIPIKKIKARIYQAVTNADKIF